MRHSEVFLNQPHVLDGELISEITKQTLRESVEKTISSLTCPSRFVCLKDADPLRFAISYFILLENKYIPILIPSECTPFQMQKVQQAYSASVLDQGVLTLISSKKTDDDISEINVYGCLTSGTTGLPKVSFHTILGALENAKAHADSLGVLKIGRVFQALPLSHAFGVIAYLWTSIIKQLPIHFSTRLLTSQNWNSLVNSSDIIHLSPALVRVLLKDKKTLIQPEILSVGGGRLYFHEFQALSHLFSQTKLFVTYGFTEAGPRVLTGQITENYFEKNQCGYMGSALSNVQIKVLNDGELKDLGQGRLCVKSPALKINTDSSEFKDGFYISQDEVILNQGEVLFLDRCDDLIKVGGVSVYPSDILSAFKEVSPFSDAVVLKEKHHTYGEVPVLFVEGDLDEKKILLSLKQILSSIQMPKKLIQIPKFPRNSFGKTDRSQLLECLL